MGEIEKVEMRGMPVILPAPYDRRGAHAGYGPRAALARDRGAFP
jgi:hypothetical protein